VLIFPNPTNDEWNINIDGIAANEILTIRLYAADGRLVLSQQLHAGAANTVSAATLPTGMYFYRIIGGNNAFTGSLSKN
jgi:hypothetical protein